VAVRPEYHGSIPGSRRFPYRLYFRIGCGVQKVSCPKDAGGSFLRGKSDGCVKLITCVSCQRLRRNGAIPSFPHTSLWLGAQVVKNRGSITFTFIRKSIMILLDNVISVTYVTQNRLRLVRKHCFLGKIGRLIFGSLRINMKKAVLVRFADSNDVRENA
jgi:hypothetical protein